MNKEWSEKNKQMQALIGKEATYKDGIDLLIELRGELLSQIEELVKSYPKEAMWQMPFPKAQGYHCKTLAYSIWHVFRIEDIVAHELIKNDTQVIFTKDFQKKIGTSYLCTGNELQPNEVVALSEEMNIDALCKYAKEVMKSTNKILTELDYSQMKRKFTDEDKKNLMNSGCVSHEESAVWLIEYWCGKDVRGLIKMPFSRHWIMHIEAMLRIAEKFDK